MAASDLFAPPSHCPECGYDLHASPATACPECGQTIYVRIGSYPTVTQASAVESTLAGVGLDVRIVVGQDPGLGIWTGASSLALASSVLVARADLAAAREAMEGHEVGLARPIVDRGEPVCPACEADLSVDGPERCEACGLEFRWVDVFEAAEHDGAEDAEPRDRMRSWLNEVAGTAFGVGRAIAIITLLAIAVLTAVMTVIARPTVPSITASLALIILAGAMVFLMWRRSSR